MHSLPDNQKNFVILCIFVLLTTAFRLWFAAKLGIAPDEAYYRQWSENLAFTYIDHPPLVAWMMRLGVIAVGDTSLGLRFFAVLFCALGTFGVYFIGREMNLDRNAAVFGAMISSLLVTPAAAAVICTPDTFLGVFGIFAVLAALHIKQGGSPVWRYVFALCLAGGVWSKHSALLWTLVLLVATFKRPVVFKLRGIAHWAAAGALFFILVLPYVVAEIRLGFPSVSFQSAHLTGRLPGDDLIAPLTGLMHVGEILSGQIGLITPLVAVFFAIYLLRVRTETSIVLKTAVLAPMLATVIAGFFTHPEQNWAAVGHPLVGPAAVSGLIHRYKPSTRPSRMRAWSLALFLSVFAVFIVIHLHALYSVLPLAPDKDPAARLHGWRALRPLSSMLNDADAAVCDNYGLAAELDWELRSSPNKNFVVTSPDRNSPPEPGNWLLLSRKNDSARAELLRMCRKTIPAAEIHLRRPDGLIWRKILVFKGFDCSY